MYFKPGKSILAVAFASLLWSAQVTPANAVMVSSTDIIIDDFMTAVNVGPNGFGPSQTGPGILGTREVGTGLGNTVDIGGGIVTVLGDPFFDATITYFIGDGPSGLDLTNGGINNGFSIGDVLLSPFDPGNGILQWPSFDLEIFVQGPDAEMSPTAHYLMPFAPGDTPLPMDPDEVLTFGSLFVDFSDFSKNPGFSFTDVGMIGVGLFNIMDPLINFTGPFAAGVSVVPLPAALPLFLTGLAGLGVIGRRRKKKAALQA